ncbi:MAG: metal ABC transporter substrate-binding protein [Elusimicrobiota bacterium]
MKRIIFLLLSLCIYQNLIDASNPLNVVTTTTDLADIAKTIGGDAVKTESLARPNQNPHFVDAKPSLIVKLTKADLFIQTGLELETGWAPLLITSSRNSKIQPGKKGFLDASQAITPIEIVENPSRSMGDVHPGGNPHYMSNPDNGLKVAQVITKKLIELKPESEELFKENLKKFTAVITEKINEWEQSLKPLKGLKFISYHKDWNYFSERFSFELMGTLEPKPGIPPNAKHTAEMINLIKSQNIKIILTDPWYEKRTGEFISSSTGAKLLELSLFPGTHVETKSYIDTIDFNIRTILNALK